MDKAVLRIVTDSNKVLVQEKGVVSEAMRGYARDLLSLGVATTQVDDILHLSGGLFGKNINGHLSHRTVGRARDEGGIASKMQLAEEGRDATGECY